MNTNDLINEIREKQKSISDLARYISTRAFNNPNYCLLLGAGCSITSGVRSANMLIEEWRRDIFSSDPENENQLYTEEAAKAYLKSKHARWYNETNEYSCLFEKKYDLRRQRRMFVEMEVSAAKPSLGYAYLTKLVEASYFNTIFTTNFDDLINEAFYLYSQERPIVCAHDSSISSITVSSKRPKIIKLHGDYLFDDIKSTMRETESLEENMRLKLAEFAKEFGLIIVGYSGADRSIMDTISHLLKSEDYYKNGIYWCLLENSEVNESLRKMLWKDRVYFVIVKGFDELFAELDVGLLNGALPIEPLALSSKPREAVDRFLQNRYLQSSGSQYIRRHLNEMSELVARNKLFETMARMDREDHIRTEYNDKEMIILLNLDELERENKQDDIEKKIREALSEHLDNESEFRFELLKRLSESQARRGLLQEAAATCDELISSDPRNPRHFLRKARYTKEVVVKARLIDEAIQVDEDYSASYHAKAELLLKVLLGKLGTEDSIRIEDCENAIQNSLRRNPSISNPTWWTKFELIQYQEYDARARKERRLAVIKELEQQDKYALRVLRMRLETISSDSKDEADQLLNDIKIAEQRRHKYSQEQMDELLLDALERLDRKSQLEEYVTQLESNISVRLKPGLFVKCINATARLDGNLEAGILKLEKAFRAKPSVTMLDCWIKFLAWSNSVAQARALLEENKHRFSLKNYLEQKMFLEEESHNFRDAKAIALQLRPFSSEIASATHETFLDLCLNEPRQALDRAKQVLESIGYNRRATALIVNYELAQKLLGKQPSLHRLAEVLKLESDDDNRAAILTLMGDKDEAKNLIRKVLNKNRLSRYLLRKWPVFSKERDILQILNSNNIAPLATIEKSATAA